jgi:hypothetical protein
MGGGFNQIPTPPIQQQPISPIMPHQPIPINGGGMPGPMPQPVGPAQPAWPGGGMGGGMQGGGMGGAPQFDQSQLMNLLAMRQMMMGQRGSM